MGEACLVAFFCLMLGRKDRTYNTKAKPPMCGRLTRGSMSVRLSYLNLAFFCLLFVLFFLLEFKCKFFLFRVLQSLRSIDPFWCVPLGMCGGITPTKVFFFQCSSQHDPVGISGGVREVVGVLETPTTHTPRRRFSEVWHGQATPY